MACNVVRIGDTTAIVCTGRQRKRPCQSCGRSAGVQCDFPVTRNGTKATCDRWCCDRCAVRVGPNRDYCLPHHRHAEKQGELFTGESAG
jgi:hypothetical protein